MSEIEKLNMIAEWQEQHKQLIEDLDNSKKQITDLEWQLQQVIEDNDYYQKENEELQEENTKAKEQLIIAKCILRMIVYWKSDKRELLQFINKAEQFIKDSEVEK